MYSHVHHPRGDVMLPQIMNAVSEEGQRLDIPQRDSAEVHRGGDCPPHLFDGLTALIQRCWAIDPAARPEFGTIITELRSLLETCRAGSQRATRKRRSDARSQPPTPPRSPARTSTLAQPLKGEWLSDPLHLPPLNKPMCACQSRP